VATLLRAEFLPQGEKINAGGVSVTAKPDYGVIGKFLYRGGRPAGSSGKKVRYFPRAKKVFP
jgi:hypothetical protein